MAATTPKTLKNEQHAHTTELKDQAMPVGGGWTCCKCSKVLFNDIETCSCGHLNCTDCTGAILLLQKGRKP
ncbi:hypothetical protein DL764_007150 [Monosporascus ibericus]|uniref:Uncharacterized protein n=1 Tax=Monosporascus ibericus TaxID=155417 RepID=A0A4V1X9V7_9PEZI|nr:hypothetical protein DL764_007150 [Monosporascus ibericus]